MDRSARRNPALAGRLLRAGLESGRQTRRLQNDYTHPEDWPLDDAEMSGFEHYRQEMRELDHEIFHYAALCGVDPSDRPAINACLEDAHETWAEDKARQSLRGLLLLRLKLESEMIEQGLSPNPLDGDRPPSE